MNAALIKLYQDVRGSYWFIPALMAALALALASGAGFIDSILTGGFIYRLPLISSVHPDDLRAVLGAIAGSMITVAGVTFSMTVVSVSYASAQFGPRLIGNFMRDRGNQVTLGTFIATFVYCIAILGTVESSVTGVAGADPTLPRVSFLIALLLTLGSITVLIYFIHHIPETIDIGHITAEIGRDLLNGIDNLFPQEIGDEGKRDPGAAAGAATRGTPCEITAAKHGYIQAIDDGTLLEAAGNADLLIRIECRPGTFVTSEKVLLHVWPAARVDDDIRARLRGAFAVGRARTPTQDTLFLADQLVEIMARALSPGVCDSFTAINCIDWLEAALGECACREAPASARYDGDGNLRVLARPVTFETVVASVADRSLQYVSADRNAAIRMMRMFGEIAVRTDRADCHEILTAEADRLVRAAKENLGLEALHGQIAEEYDRTKALIAAGPATGRSRDALGRLEVTAEQSQNPKGNGAE